MNRTHTPFLFLDFDGVLSRGLSASFDRAPFFWEWMHVHPSVGVVISSDWRLSMTLPQLRDYFPDDLAERIVDVTPDLTAQPSGDDAGEFLYRRQREIELWRARNAAAGPYAALDDTPSLFAPGWRHLVLTDSAQGATAKELSSVENLLGVRR